MKKKLILGMFAAAGLLLASSCQTDELDATSQLGGAATVTFNLVQPGISTRAYSDGLTATTLTYAVYENGSKTPLITSEDEVTFSNKTATVSLTLVSGKSYDIIFWADAPVAADGTNPYTFSAADQTITVDYSSVSSQDESRDAFFADTTLTVNGAINETIKLHRPFSQLNIGTVDATEAKQAGFVPATSEVKVSNVYSTLNLLTGEVSNGTSVTYAAADLPDASTETFPFTMAGQTFTYLSMNYLLVAEEKELVDIDFTVVGEDNHEIPIDFVSVPVQRNYRTNIYGGLLTDQTNFTIVIEPDYETPDIVYPSTSKEELLMVAANGGSVTLYEDVTLTEPLYIAAGKSVVIDLNGYTISAPAGYDRTLQVNEGSTLVINGDGVVGSLDSGALAVAVNGGTLTINGGTYYGGPQCSCIYMFRYEDGTIVINGGYFAVAEPANYGKEWYYVLNLQNGATGTISVTGGTFENYNPAEGDDADGGNFVADGYYVTSTTDEEGNTLYTVEPIPVAADSDALATAAATEGATIGLKEGETYTLPATVADGVTIDGNGATLTTTQGQTLTGNDITISDVVLSCETSGSGNGILSIEGTGVVLDGLDVTSTSTNGQYGIIAKSGSSVTISNSTFDQTSFSRIVYGYSGSVVNLENCVFSENVTYAYNSSGGTLNATNCEFHGWLSGWQDGGTFTNCTFEYGSAYYPCAVCYGTTTFSGCSFGKYGHPYLNSSSEPTNNPIEGTTYGYDCWVSNGASGTTITFTGCSYSNGDTFDTDVFIRLSGDGKKDPDKVVIDDTTYTDIVGTFRVDQ